MKLDQQIASSSWLNSDHQGNQMDIDSTGLGGDIRQLASTGFKFAENNAVLKDRPAKLVYLLEPAKVISVHEKVTIKTH